MEIFFYLPDKISTNKIYSGIHWGVRKKHKTLFKSVPFVASKVKKFPVHITFDFYFKKYPLDCSNVSYMAKLIEDTLVLRGVIPDDSPKYVSGITMTSKKGDDDMCLININ